MQQSERENVSFMFMGYWSEETYECISYPDYRILSSLSLFFSSIFPSTLQGDLLLLYIPLKLIRTLHLFTIRTFTWVPVPSDTPLILLWVALANVILFVCLLYINAAGKVASLHLMRQLWLPPGRLTLSICLGWLLTVDRAYVGSHLVCPRRRSSSDVL